MLRPLVGPSCRYLPSCSHYAEEAIERWGTAPWRGCWRLGGSLRCHPFSAGGLDPVPERGRTPDRGRAPCDAGRRRHGQTHAGGRRRSASGSCCLWWKMFPPAPPQARPTTPAAAAAQQAPPRPAGSRQHGRRGAPAAGTRPPTRRRRRPAAGPRAHPRSGWCWYRRARASCCPAGAGRCARCTSKEERFLRDPEDPSSGCQIVGTTAPEQAPLRTTFPKASFASPDAGSWTVSGRAPTRWCSGRRTTRWRVEKRYKVEGRLPPVARGDGREPGRARR